MSVELIVYLRRSAMPSLYAWQQAIHATGLPVELDDDQGFNADTSSGFRPCKVRGTVTGFEYYASPMSAEESDEVGAPPGSDFSVVLATHFDLQEFACSAVVAASLAQVSGGLLVDPQSGESFSSTEAVSWAAGQFAEAERAWQ